MTPGPLEVTAARELAKRGYRAAPPKPFPTRDQEATMAFFDRLFDDAWTKHNHPADAWTVDKIRDELASYNLLRDLRDGRLVL